MILFKNKVDLKIIILHPFGEFKKEKRSIWKSKRAKIICKLSENKITRFIDVFIEEILAR